MPGPTEPTIYDVAAQAGVSITTVSRVLNMPHLVQPATRQRVLKAIDELGFVPRAEASARARKSIGRIGVLSPFFTFPSFVQRMRGVAGALSGSAYELVIYPVDSADRLHGYLAMLPTTRRLDGMVVMSLPMRPADAERLRRHHLPTVTIEFHCEGFTSIEIDDVEGGRMAGRYFAQQGHQQVAFLGFTDLPIYSLHPGRKRLEGFRQGLAEAGLGLAESQVYYQPIGERELRPEPARLFEANPRPTAVFAEADELALLLIQAARQRGLRIPQDIAVLGFDDIDIAGYVGLSTIRQHLDESGQIAAEHLVKLIAGSTQHNQRVVHRLALVQRESA